MKPLRTVPASCLGSRHASGRSVPETRAGARCLPRGGPVGGLPPSACSLPAAVQGPGGWGQRGHPKTQAWPGSSAPRPWAPAAGPGTGVTPSASGSRLCTALTRTSGLLREPVRKRPAALPGRTRLVTWPLPLCLPRRASERGRSTRKATRNANQRAAERARGGEQSVRASEHRNGHRGGISDQPEPSAEDRRLAATLGSACPQRSAGNRGWARGGGRSLLEVLGSVAQRDGDKSWHCRCDTGENGFPREGGAELCSGVTSVGVLSACGRAMGALREGRRTSCFA